MRAHKFSFDAKHGLFDTMGRDNATLFGMQAAKRPLADANGGIDAGKVCGFDVVLGDDVDGGFARVDEVSQRVLGLVEAAGEAEDEHGGVVCDEVEVAEGGQVGACRVCACRGYEANGAWHNGGDEQLVVVDYRTALLVGVDGPVRFA